MVHVVFNRNKAAFIKNNGSTFTQQLTDIHITQSLSN